MPRYETIDFTEQELEELREVLEEAKTEYGFEKVMPQTEAVLEQFPGINPMGHYSEIDMGITDRLKRCEYASRMRDPLAWEVYQDVKNKIEKTYEYQDMKAKMLEISQKAYIYDRAIRLTDNPKVVEYLEAKKEELKQDPVMEEYDKYFNILEHLSGVKFFDKKQEAEQSEMSAYLKEKYDVTLKDTKYYIVHEQVLKFSNPKSIEIEFENFDNMVMFQRVLDDKNLGKQVEEIEAEPVETSDMKRYVSTIPAYVEASCDRALDAALPDAKDRADMLFIDGRSIRDMMKEEDEFQDKEPTEEEIKKYSNVYVAFALRNGIHVEAFTKDKTEGRSINYKPVPITAKGENSYIKKKGGATEMEKITINFLDRFLAKLGFKHFIDKIKAAERAEFAEKKAEELEKRLEASREAFRKAHFNEMKISMKKEEIKNRNQAIKLLHKHKDTFFTLHENVTNFGSTIEKIESLFFPEGKKDIVNKATGIVRSYDREYLRTLAVAQMLKEGYSLEQILDTSSHMEEKVQCAKNLREELENCGEKEFFEKMFDYQKILIDGIEDYAQKHNISFKNPASIWEYPSQHLMDIVLGIGNMTDFMLGEDYKQKVEDYFGKEFAQEADKISRNCMVIGMLPKNVGKCEQSYCNLAEGKIPKEPQSDIFSNAVKEAVTYGVIAKFEKPGQIFSPKVDVIEVEYIHQMVMAHPNTLKFLKNNSNEKLMEVIAKGDVLKELKVDFKILEEKMMPAKDLESVEFDVNIFMGDKDSRVGVVPTFNGSSKFYEMDTPENVKMKKEEMEAEL